MNTLKMKSLSCLLLGANLLIQAQSGENLYKIGQWKDFTNAAITYTFDDNCSNQYSVAIPLFNENNFNATFFVVTDWNPDWMQFTQAAKEGHEIGSHTISHKNMAELSDSLQNLELKNSYETINKHLETQHCLTMAYPFCVPAKEQITSRYYIAARHCQGNIEQSTPSDFFTISSIICGNQGSLKTLNDFKENASIADSLNGWSVYLLHGIDDDGGYSPLSSTVLRESLEFFNTHRDRFWVATFADVVRYIKERDAAEIKEIEANADSILLQIHDTLPNTIYNVPITIARLAPEGWKEAVALQNGNTLRVSFKEIDGVIYMVFNAVPDAGVISIAVKNKSMISENIGNFN